VTIRRIIALLLAAWCLCSNASPQSPVTSAPTDSLHPQTLMERAKRLSDDGQYVMAMECGEKALDAWKRHSGTHTMEYAQCLSDLAGYHSHLGDYAGAIRLGTEALQLREQLAGTLSAEYAQSLNNIARYHSYSGNYIKAVSLGRDAMQLRAAIFGKESTEYANSVSNLAGYHSRLGNYEKALTLGMEALDIRRRVKGEMSNDYAESLNNISKYHYYLGQYDDAISRATEALQLRRQLLGEKHPIYATTLSNLADYYMKKGDLAQAMRYGTQAMETRLEALGENHPEYAESVSNIASYHYALGNTEEAINYGRLAMNLRLRLLGENHISYAHSMCKMAIYFTANEQTDSADYYALKATERYTTNVMHTFADLTPSERDRFWHRVRPWFTNTLLLLTSAHPTPSMVGSALNGTLLAKGLLLNSELEMTNLLMESSDSTMISAYQALQANRALLIRMQELPPSQRNVNIDSLQRAITHQERRLVKRSKTYGNYTKSLVIGWQDVVRHLKPQDVAIEFACYKDNNGLEQYGAFVMPPRTTQPIWVPLTNSSQIKAIEANKLYNTSQLSRLIWQPLAPYLDKATRVYFSPAGELYNIGIESLPHWEDNGELVGDRWTLYRLSSTRELALQRQQPKENPSIVVFGGITYDDATKSGQHKKKRAAKYLPGTKKEAEEIARNFSEQQIPTSLYIGADASETAFKQLSGHAPAIIHIATHGFYWTDSEVRKGGLNGKVAFLAMYDEMDAPDQALLRSGLLFAGANETLTGEEETMEHENGVLTAKEISVLDLRSTNLLVLSACQTALGKITGDGVFGLQRGLKKAGAKSLLMTLWKVDDVATRQLMSFFYGYLLQGMDAHEALRQAQHDLRTMTPTDNGNRSRRHAISSRQKRARKAAQKPIYDDPYYWAAFILLDAF